MTNEETRESAVDDTRDRFGIATLVALAAGGAIGSGWLIAAPGVQQAAGTLSPLAWGLGGLFMVAIAWVMVELGRRVPENGGLVFWPSETTGPLVTTMVAAALWFFYAINPASEAVAMLYGGKGDLSVIERGSASLAMIPIMAVNLLALRHVLRIIVALTAFKVLAPILVVAVLLVWHPHWQALGHVPRHTTGNALGAAMTAITASGVVYAYIGFQGPLDFAGQVRVSDSRTETSRLRWAVLATVIGSILLYVGLQVAYTVQLGWRETGQGSSFIQLLSGVPNLGGVLSGFLKVMEVLSPAGAGLVFTLLLVREVEQLSINGFTDGRLLDNRRLPFKVFRDRDILWRILLLNLVIGVVGLFALGSDWEKLTQASAVLALLVYAMSAVSLAAYGRSSSGRHQEVEPLPPLLRLVCGLCFVISAVIMYWAGWAILLRGIIVIAAGSALLFFLPSDFARRLPLMSRYSATSQLHRLSEHRSEAHVKAALVYVAYILAPFLLSAAGAPRLHWLDGEWGTAGSALTGWIAFRYLVRFSVRYMGAAAAVSGAPQPAPVTTES